MKIQEKTEPIAEVAVNKGEIVHIAPPRLPYHDLVQERFGIDKAGWRVLVDATFPSAKTVDAIIMALSYCKARNLDPFKRPVYVVPMWSSSAGRMIETVWPSISELRTTAFRTGQYAGMEAPEFGPMIEREFSGTVGRGPDKGKIIKATIKFPEWCRVTVIRTLHGKERKFVGPTVYWLETYAKRGDTEVPNEIWCRRVVGQLEKCAEAGGLRRAFPEELGNELTAEEMEGQRWEAPGDVAKDVTPKTQDEAPPDPAVPSTETPIDEAAQWLRDLEGAFGGCEDMSTLAEKQHELMMPMREKVSPSFWSEAEGILQEHIVRITGEAPESDEQATGTIIDAG
jgi:phage recombination protein Bet